MRRRRLKYPTNTVKTAGRKTGNVRKLLRLASVGAVLTGLAVLGLPSVAQAKPVKPTVSSFAVTPTSLSPSGGSVTLSAQVTSAASCVFSSNRIVTELPVTTPCSNGTVTEVVSIPANARNRAVTYKLHLSVTGTKTVNAKAVTLTVAAGGLPTVIVAGAEHTCALLAGGTVDCWGENASGQLGNGTTTNAYTPVAVSGLRGATAVAGGTFAFHSCALLSGGTVECWGDNQYGQLGNGTTTGSTLPVAVSGLSGATAISGGLGSTCALLGGGTVDCWGDNQYGQLGDGTTTGSTTPVAVSGLSGATAIAVEDDHTCALLIGETVECWGYNSAGQLGDGTTAGPEYCLYVLHGVPSEPCSTTPVAVDLSGATALAGGDGGSCALLTGGTVDCWGENDYGLLGNGTFSSSSGSATPVAVSDITDATAITATGGGACALLAGGTVDCWGANLGGELGDGTTSGPETCANSIPCNTSPGAVIGLSGATAVAGGGSHACALIVAGSIDCWGDNTGGDLGNGTKRTDLPAPVPVKRLP